MRSASEFKISKIQKNLAGTGRNDARSSFRRNVRSVLNLHRAEKCGMRKENIALAGRFNPVRLGIRDGPGPTHHVKVIVVAMGPRPD